MKEKESFIYYKDWAKYLDAIPQDISTIILRAYNHYIATGETPKDKQILFGYFGAMKARTEKDVEIWKAKCEQNRENGNKGGRPKKRTVNTKTEKSERLTPKPKKADNDNVNDSAISTITHNVCEGNFSNDEEQSNIAVNESDVFDGIVTNRASELGLHLSEQSKKFQIQYEILQRYCKEQKFSDNATARTLLRFTSQYYNEQNAQWQTKDSKPIQDVLKFFVVWVQENKQDIKGRYQNIKPQAISNAQAFAECLGIPRQHLLNDITYLCNKFKKEHYTHGTPQRAMEHLIRYIMQKRCIKPTGEQTKKIEELICSLSFE